MKKSKHPQWALKQKKPGTELRFLAGTYYLYAISSKWDPIKKRAKKITGKLLGKITQADGFIESDKYKLLKAAQNNKTASSISSKLRIKEFGLSAYVERYAKKYVSALKNNFTELYAEIICLACIRLAYQSPIKNVQYKYERSFLSELYPEINLSEKNVGLLLKEIGRSRNEATGYMKEFINKGDYVLIDGTHVITSSKNIDIAKRGYNSSNNYDPQINAMFIFSATQKEPIFHRVVPGNVRDIKSFKLTIQESGINDAVIIADKGFYSDKNIIMLDEEELKYLMPLKRNSEFLDYGNIEKTRKMGFEGYFPFQKRFIWYYEKKISESKRIILFFDEDLRAAEEKDYLSRIETHPEEYSLEDFRNNESTFGTIGIYTNITDKTAKQIYEYYKSRIDIEIMFDAMKNILEADYSYLQSTEGFQGWMFINHVALQLYYSIYQLLVQAELISKYSVRDIVMFLTDVKKIKIENEWVCAETIGRVEKVFDRLGLHIT